MRRDKRHVAAALVVAVLAVAAPLRGRAADAAAGAPAEAASGWYVTGRQAAEGVEMLSIRRDDPVERGTVAVMPRSGLYRLRTVLASDQLVGGTGFALPTTLCARVHCLAGVNGDRWEVAGPETGRIVGAVAVDNELIATQPLPPYGPEAHLLVGRSGSMEGTIEVPLPIAPEISAGAVTLPVDVNRQPTPGRTSIFNRRYSTETLTPGDTVEYVLSDLGGSGDERALAPVTRRVGTGPIPEGSVVVAASGADEIIRTDDWWSEALFAGTATYRPGADPYREVIGGSPLLLHDSTYGFPTETGDGRHARTIIGWDATRLWLVTVDGGQPAWSRGLDLVESAQLMRWLGATDALNLDGGSSSAFVGFGALRTRPSLGTQRAVAEALVIVPPEARIAAPPPARSLDAACPADQVPPAPFSDIAGSVHARAIACMAWRHIAAGATATTYEPLRAVRRDQMATLLARYLTGAGVVLPTDPPDAFPDDDGSVHEPAINALAAMGIIGGRADGRYAPASAVTRGQMASLLARAVLPADAPHTTDFFADDAGDVHEYDINTVTEAAIAGGTADGTYRSGDPVRRDQIASFLARAQSAAMAAG